MNATLNKPRLSFTEVLIGLAVIIYLLSSCASTLPPGRYKIESINGDIAVFHGINATFHVPDTLRQGQIIRIRRTTKQAKANIW